MDAKNLEVLRELKEKLEAEAAPVPPPKNASGFSEASEAAFREIARRNIDSGNLTPPRKKRRLKALNSHAKKSPALPREPLPPLPPKAAARRDKKPKDTRPPVWDKRLCRFCKAEFTVNLNWNPLPIMCSNCRNARKVRIGKSAKASPSIYTNIQVFGGGAPGLGKRH
jgi:hypothetical protein